MKIRTLKSVFERTPGGFGLRGDDHLWLDLKRHLENEPRPKTTEEFMQLLHSTVIHLTGQALEPGKDFYVEKYSHGGMSSGMVCSDFWLEKGFPELHFRYIIGLNLNVQPDSNSLDE